MALSVFDVLDAATAPQKLSQRPVLPLFATGVGALGLLGWLRKRKNAA